MRGQWANSVAYETIFFGVGPSAPRFFNTKSGGGRTPSPRNNVIHVAHIYVCSLSRFFLHKYLNSIFFLLCLPDIYMCMSQKNFLFFAMFFAHNFFHFFLENFIPPHPRPPSPPPPSPSPSHPQPVVWWGRVGEGGFVPCMQS